MGLDNVSCIVYIVDDDTAVRDSLNLFIQSRGMLARDKEKAKILDISYRTIEAHRAQIMKKLEADTLPELIKMFIKNGSLQDI